MKRMVNNAETLEHLIFKANDISFSDNSSVKLSESLEAKQLVERIKYCYDNQAPLIIYEYANDKVFITTAFESDSQVYLHNLGTSKNVVLTLSYDGQDTLSMSVQVNSFLTTANAPKMYRHNLVINDTNYFTIYSSNNLVADTPEKLTTLLKSENQDIYYFGFRQTQYIDGVALQFNGGTNLWEVRAGGEESSSTITTIADTVEEA